MKQEKPYGAWPSPINARDIVSSVAGLSELRALGGRLYWLESRPTEQGRTTLVCRNVDLDNSRQAGNLTGELTPSPYNVRSRVHEYGGGAFTPTDLGVFFVNFSDQNLYCLDTNGEIRQITHSDDSVRFADPCLDPGNNRLICVREIHHPADVEPVNELVSVAVTDGATAVLHDQHDFYSSPTVSPGGDQLAFIAWDHPNMPWDGASLIVASWDEGGRLTGAMVIAGGAQEAVSQPRWQNEDTLLFLSDLSGFTNLYRYDATGVYCALPDEADYGQPSWVFGLSDYCCLDAAHAIVRRQNNHGQALTLVNTESSMSSPITDDTGTWQRFDYLCCVTVDSSRAICFVAGHETRAPTIELFSLALRSTTQIHAADGPAFDVDDIASGIGLTYPTRDGRSAHAFYYPPTNGRFEAPDSEKPPLLVMSHGGPTAACDNTLNFRIQYYTSRGWAVVDVNYRGSSGFGRDYRTALNGRWGIVDVDDCEDAARHLANKGLADSDRIAIRGGSAGGFTTLAALTRSKQFSAGASHYGIGDLNALARDTHKFESRYLNVLLGDEAALSDRSPINHVDRLNCPVIFFQGSDDKIVPPNQSRSMADVLRNKGIPVAYLEFPGEGHGFRSSDNIVCAQESEYAFFCRIFGIVPADSLPLVKIDNVENLEHH